MRGALRLVGVLVAIALAGPAASFAACTSGATRWIDGRSGNWFDDRMWSRGAPGVQCVAYITRPGTYEVKVEYGIAYARSLTLGGASVAATLTLPDALLVASDRGVTVAGRGALALEDGHVNTRGALRLAGGSLHGYGSVTARGGVINRGGAVRVVERESVADYGQLAIDGDYTQDHAATLDLGPHWFEGERRPPGVLDVSGRATLAGSLRTQLPGQWRNLRIVATGARIGRFDHVTVVGRRAHLRYDGHGVRLAEGFSSAPVLRRVRIDRPGSGPAILTLTASEDSDLVVAFFQRQAGHRGIVGCSSGPPKGDQKPCVRVVFKKRLFGTARRGSNRFGLDLSGLTPGHYRVTVTATDRDGNRARVRRSIALRRASAT